MKGNLSPWQIYWDRKSERPEFANAVDGDYWPWFTNFGTNTRQSDLLVQFQGENRDKLGQSAKLFMVILRGMENLSRRGVQFSLLHIKTCPHLVCDSVDPVSIDSRG